MKKTTMMENGISRMERALGRGVNPLDPRAGFTQFPNLWLDIQFLFTPTEWAIMSQFIRLTLGYHRNGVELGIDEIGGCAGVSRSTVQVAVKSLVEYGILSQAKKGGQGRGNKTTWVLTTDPNKLNVGALVFAFSDRLGVDLPEIEERLFAAWAKVLQPENLPCDEDDLAAVAVASGKGGKEKISAAEHKKGIASALQSYSERVQIGEDKAGVSDPHLEQHRVAEKVLLAWAEWSGVAIPSRLVGNWTNAIQKVLKTAGWNRGAEEAKERLRVLFDDERWSWHHVSTPHNRKFQEDFLFVLLQEHEPDDGPTRTVDDLLAKRGY